MERRIPEALMGALRPITVIVGHYGTGKTNLAVNLALDLARAGKGTTLIDIDVVNPYFRASEQRTVLEAAGVDLVAPVFSEAGTSLDVPSLTGRIEPAIQGAGPDRFVIIDAGGDDVGATALGRFARFIDAPALPDGTARYAMLCVLNRYRNLVQDPQDALDNLREIETASHLRATGLISNAHMKAETQPAHIAEGLAYAREVSKLAGLPLVAFTYPATIGSSSVDEESALPYCVELLVRTPWEQE